MTDDLFSDDEMSSLSPPDKWAADNSITVYHDEELALPWVAWKRQTKTQGHTKEGALLAMAGRLKIEFYR
jgi:hypothetical protein